MAKPKAPRHGSMQFWPRSRAKSESARLRGSIAARTSSTPKLLGFAGYKAAMTHIIYTDSDKNSLTKGEQVSAAVTVVECPPMTIVGIRAYGVTDAGYGVIGQVFAQNMPKDVKKELGFDTIPAQTFDQLSGYTELRALVATHPNQTGFGKKAPDVFELGVGGDIAKQKTYLADKLGHAVQVSDVFAPGDLVDTHSVTKGKGFQGSVRRFGIGIRSHKSEKTKRGPGTLGGWKAQMHFMYRVPMSGQMGYHQRTDYNKSVLSIGTDPVAVNPKGGISQYGLVKTTYVLIKGSVSGAKKRLIKLTPAIRPSKRAKIPAPAIEHISTEAQN
jgi:large subunit ribosomal protein L3